VRALFLVCLAGCAARPSRPAVAAAQPAPVAVAAGEVRSNILRRDYAGSRACAPCHGDIYDKFMAAPMHNMTRLPGEAKIAAPFDGSRFHFKDDTVAFESAGGDHFMRIESAQFGNRLFKVTKVIGGHYREDFAGVEVGTQSHDERILPASYFLSTNSWRYKGYSVMGPERPGLRPGGVWNKTCIFCHNTIPYLSDILGALSSPPAGAYQGEVVDPLLPPERRNRFVVTDTAALERALGDEIRFLRSTAPPHPSAQDAVRATRGSFAAAHVVELGIGCESCHGGSIEHVRHYQVKPSFDVRSEFLAVRPEQRPPAQAVTRVCARCHQVLFTRYAWTWEGAARGGAHSGGSNINSGEARDFLLGGCASAMSCTACHDPHAHNRPLRDDLEARADRICIGCHAQLATPEAQRAHTHHDPAGAGGRCLACHMPKKNMSLDNRLTRYHRIASPTETAKVEGDRPLECALCHGDRTVGELVANMEAWWGKSYDRARLRNLYGDDLAHALPLGETLARGKPHEQAVALTLLGERKQRELVPLMAAQLTHPIPILRYYAVNALEATLGGRAPLDVHAKSDAIVAAARRWLLAAGFRFIEPPTVTSTSASEADE
jgi:predicted CXXCH cytochrome family protein